jgi:hypothetical protein
LTPSSPTPVRTVDDLVHRVMQPRSIEVDFSQLAKGIDNYHVDVALSPTFVLLGQELIQYCTRKIVAGAKVNNPTLMDSFRNSYSDMLRATLHRTKTDLTAGQITILQFAIIKFLLLEARQQLAAMVQQLEETLAQQQFAGSRDLLATQARFFWMRQHHDEFLYKINRTVFRLLQREENNQLRSLRAEQLEGLFRESVSVMFNPMLGAVNPQSAWLLLECYTCWPNSRLSELTVALENILAKHFTRLPLLPLRRFDRFDSVQSEVYDELGGLFAAQSLLGPAEDQQDHLLETFCWLEQPGNIRLLFDASLHAKSAEDIRATDGVRAQWQFNSEMKKLQKIALELRKTFVSDSDGKLMLAGYQLRDAWSEADNELLELEQACKYIAGIDVKKIAARLAAADKGASELLKRLDELVKENAMRFKAEAEELALKCLTDYCRYRLHLRFYQLAHRIFNRLHVITDAQQVQLSKAGGHLYQLLSQDEFRDEGDAEPAIVHHTILKADVRGSTTVTQELIRQNLNPASYFSLRFFEPINQLLSVYGALKVFIEGDAVILAIHEHNNQPEQWYAVARACGLAKDMIDIVNSKNAHAKQTGLPLLEIGVGIAFADEKPMFLFDDEQPIMISPAIGAADRMSSCSWKLRQRFDGGTFNVEVLDISAKELHQGEKGQVQLRYNVNGILLANEAFEKLQAEIGLKELRVKLADGAHIMYVGRFPDVAGKMRELVIREGRAQIWENEKTLQAGDDATPFYEVLPHSKIANQVLEVARKLD